MRVLVTGGAGYVGSVTSAALLRAGHDVVVLDDFSSGHRDAVPDAAVLAVADVTDPVAVDRVLELHGPFDACLHFAALIEAGESMRAPERYFRTNTGGSAVLLEKLHTHRIDRFVLSSTAAVYGDPGVPVIDETIPTSPTNAYGESKLLVERMLAWHQRVHGLKVACLRYFNAAGAVDGLGERHDPETHLIPIILDVAAGNRDAIDVFGTDYPTSDGTAVRDFVHVADLADAHVLALDALDDSGSLTINLGSGNGYSVLEVIEAARRVTGNDVPVRLDRRRAGDPVTLVASNERAHTALGWAPKRAHIDEIVTDAWRFAQATTAQ